MKPTVFLSHASADEHALGVLKAKLVVKTNNVIDFFLASDGQSIPLGRNWAHRIEEHLKLSTLMFVFLSPASIQSQWVFFEAGFAYSRDIRVVPVAIVGVDLAHIRPPLGLLQGFNLRGRDGLNNLVAVLNAEFGLTFPETFTETDFREIFGADSTGESSILGRYAAFVDELQVRAATPSTEALKAAKQAVGECQLKASVSEGAVTTFGAAFQANERGDAVAAKLDPSLLNVTLPLVSAWLEILRLRNPIVEVVVRMHQEVRHIREPHKLTARLFGTPIEFTAEGGLQYNGADLKIDRGISVTARGPAAGRVYIQLTTSIDSFAALSFAELLNLLFDRQILFVPTVSDTP